MLYRRNWWYRWSRKWYNLKLDILSKNSNTKAQQKHLQEVEEVYIPFPFLFPFSELAEEQAKLPVAEQCLEANDCNEHANTDI